jgi:hypothetical protein
MMCIYSSSSCSRSTDDTVNEIKELFTKSALPMASTASFPVPPTGHVSSNNAAYDLPKPKQEDYPEIRFWNKRDYLQIETEKRKTAAVLDPMVQKQRAPRGSTRLAQSDENVATDYIEMENGDIVSGTTAQSIRSTLRNLLKEIKEKVDMTLPEVWRDIGQIERKFILNGLYTNFPYIRLCDDDWKACFLTSRVLTNMKHTEKRRQRRMSIKTELDSAADFEDDMDLDEVAGPSLASLPSTGSKRKSSFLELDKIEPTKCGRTDSVLSILPSDPPEPTSFEIHNTAFLPMPPPVTSTQADAAGHHKTAPESDAVTRQSPHDHIPTQSAAVPPAQSLVRTKINTLVSQAVDDPEVKPRPKLVRRVPLQDRPVQHNIPRLELIDLEPTPHNPNLVRRVKHANTSESMSATATLQPPLPIHTHVEVETTPAAASADVDQTTTDPSSNVQPVCDTTQASQLERGGRQDTIVIANPLFVSFCSFNLYPHNFLQC